MKKIKWLSLAAVALPIAPVLCAISCENSKASFNEKTLSKKVLEMDKNYIVPLQNYHEFGKNLRQTVTKEKYDSGSQTTIKTVEPIINLYKPQLAEIVNWSDGDTPRVRFLNEDGTPALDKKGNQIIQSIRITGVDTVEEAVPNKEVPLFEKGLSAIDTAWAEQTLPEGTKVLVLSEGGSSYNRTVGDLLFGDPGETDPNNFNKSYSVELLASGYTLPRQDDVMTQFVSNLGNTSKTLGSFLAPYWAYAFVQGIQQKRGFYDPNNEAMKQWYEEFKNDPAAQQAGVVKNSYFKNFETFQKAYATHGSLETTIYQLILPTLIENKSTRISITRESNKNFWEFVRTYKLK